MTKRTVTFVVGVQTDDTGEITGYSVTPAIPLYGGVKGEHNATVLGLTLEGGLYTDGELVRLSFTTGDGTILSSDLIEDIAVAEDGAASITYPLPQLLTIAAGQLCVRVVLSTLEDGRETVIWRSAEMVLYFEEAGVENGTPFWTGVSEMLARTVTAKDTATASQEAAAKSATEAQGYAQDADTARENAENAQAAAEAAAESANEAKSAALVASADAQEAKESARQYMVYASEAAEAAQAVADNATPHIGDDGNWYIGDTDTGVKAAGEDGADGKSAYEYAQDGGYEGTEEAFAAALADLEQMRTDIDANTGAHKAIVVAHTELETVVGSNTDRITANETDIGSLSALTQANKEGALDLNERLSVIEAQELLRWRGEVTGSAMDQLADKQVGDVVFCTTDNCFYVYHDGWKPCMDFTTAVTQESGKLVTSGAVYNFVADKIAAVYRYKGSVDTYDKLADITEKQVGDVYNVIWEYTTEDSEDYILSGQNYAWTGTEWDALGRVLNLVKTVESGSEQIPTSDAVYAFVTEKIAAYDADVMAVLGVDEE